MHRGAAALSVFSLLLAAIASPPAGAEDLPLRSDWGGSYIGAHLGGALSLTDADDPFGASIYGDTVRAPGPVAGGQLGYNWQFGRGLIGLEADVSGADLLGTGTCFAYSGSFISANCRNHTDAFGTLAARFGSLIGPDAQTLLYGKAGAAWLHGDVGATTNGVLGNPSTSADGTRWGWMLGAGIERALSQRWSLSAEYDFLSFGNHGLSTPVGAFQPVPSTDPTAVIPVASVATDFSSELHLFKLGLNYRLDGSTLADVSPAPTPRPIAGATLEVGMRYVYGWGRLQEDLGGIGTASLESRLTYSALKTNGAEAFARLDLASGLMIKGFLGKGKDTGAGSGKLNDEDWAVPFSTDFVPYSNTLSKVETEIDYGAVDVGYDLWRDARFRVTPFVGFSIFHQDMAAFGCVQLANPNSDCVPSVPTSVEAITEDDTRHALRLGVAADAEILPGLTLSADAAYLPYAHFTGVDDHIRRDLVSPETANGIGTQLELALKYALTDRISVGVGGRYWAMWTSDGVVDFGGQGLAPMRYSTEQAALLVEGSYTFGGN